MLLQWEAWAHGFLLVCFFLFLFFLRQKISTTLSKVRPFSFPLKNHNSIVCHWVFFCLFLYNVCTFAGIRSLRNKSNLQRLTRTRAQSLSRIPAKQGQSDSCKSMCKTRLRLKLRLNYLMPADLKVTRWSR